MLPLILALKPLILPAIMMLIVLLVSCCCGCRRATSSIKQRLMPSSSQSSSTTTPTVREQAAMSWLQRARGRAISCSGSESRKASSNAGVVGTVEIGVVQQSNLPTSGTRGKCSLSKTGQDARTRLEQRLKNRSLSLSEISASEAGASFPSTTAASAVSTSRVGRWSRIGASWLPRSWRKCSSDSELGASV